MKTMPALNFLTTNPAKRTAHSGYTLIELAITIALIALVSAIGIANWSMTDEVRDANMIQSTQAALQQVISQGSSRADMSPEDLVTNGAQRTNIVNAVRLLLQNRPQITFTDLGIGQPFRITITSTGRWGNFLVDPNSGNVACQNLSGTFINYNCAGGVIARN